MDLHVVLSTIFKKFVDVSFNSTARPINNDKISWYAEQVISIGSLHAELTDAIREGDGTRVIRCWRYLMIIFHNSNRKNYTKEAVILLHQYQYVLSPQQISEVLHARFINTRGVPGANISADLYMEHLNQELKVCMSNLGSNKFVFVRLGKAIGVLAPILHQFDKVNDVMHHQTRHKAAKMNKDMLQIVKQLNKTKMFVKSMDKNSTRVLTHNLYYIRNRKKTYYIGYRNTCMYPKALVIIIDYT